jgi:hypothetical protein
MVARLKNAANQKNLLLGLINEATTKAKEKMTTT